MQCKEPASLHFLQKLTIRHLGTRDLMEHNTTHDSTAQHRTAQHRTAQHSTVPHNTGQQSKAAQDDQTLIKSTCALALTLLNALAKLLKLATACIASAWEFSIMSHIYGHATARVSTSHHQAHLDASPPITAEMLLGW